MSNVNFIKQPCTLRQCLAYQSIFFNILTFLTNLICFVGVKRLVDAKISKAYDSIHFGILATNGHFYRFFCNIFIIQSAYRIELDVKNTAIKHG